MSESPTAVINDLTVHENNAPTLVPEVYKPELKTKIGKIDFESVSPTEVMNFVSPDGVCRDLGCVRVSEQPLLLPEFEETISPRMRVLFKEATPRVERTRGYLKAMLVDKTVINELQQKDEDGQFGAEDISRIFGLGKEYSWEVKRLDSILNKNIDPELIPIVIESFVVNNQLPAAVTDAVKNDFYLISKISDLINNQTFHDEFWLNGRPGATPYPTEIKQEIDYIIKLWVTDAQKEGVLDDTQTESIRESLNNFFNADKKFWTQEAQTGTNTIGELYELTNRQYVEYRVVNDMGTENWYSAHGNNSNLKGFIKHSKAFPAGEYLVGLHKTTMALYQDLFPEIFTDFELNKLKMIDPNLGYLDRNYKPNESCDLSNGSWEDDTKTITIKSGTLVRAERGDDIANELAFHFAGPKVRRLLSDFITDFHEITHGIYSKRVHKGIIGLEKYHSTADHAINEGLSVTMELLAIDALKANAEAVGLSHQDVLQLEECKQARLYSLKKQKNGYTEGTYRIFHKIYADAAGKGEERDMRKGLSAISDFISKLDTEKTLSIKRDSPEYLEALKAGDPNKWLGLFSKVST